MNVLPIINKSQYFSIALFLFFSCFLFNSTKAQTYIKLGTGTEVGLNSAIRPSAGDLAYHTQFIYTKAEINQQGIFGPSILKNFGFFVEEFPRDSLSNFIVKIQATDSINVRSYTTPLPNSIALNLKKYMPKTRLNYDTLTLSTPYQWDGNSNILLDICYEKAKVGYGGLIRIYEEDQSNDLKFASIINIPASVCNVVTNNEGEKPQALLGFCCFTVDASPTKISLPSVPFKANTEIPLKINFRNNGNAVLTSLKINYYIDENQNGSYDWTGTLSSNSSVNDLEIGQFKCEIGNNTTIKVWTSSPNQNVDQFKTNDTITVKNIFAGFEGQLSIGFPKSKFNNFTEALNALSVGGLIDSTVFLVKDSTYLEQINIKAIIGSSEKNFVKFIGNNPDPNKTKVILSDAGFGRISALEIRGGDNLKFENFYFENNSPSSLFHYAIFLNDTSENIHIKNCIAKSNGIGVNINNSCMYMQGLNNNSVIENIQFIGGSYGIYFYGIFSGPKPFNNVFINNSFQNQHFKAIYAERLDVPIINGNTIKFSNIDTGFKGIELKDCIGKFSILNNKIYLKNAKAGIELNKVSSFSNADAGLISNNFISVANENKQSTCLKLSDAHFIHLVFNSLVNTSSVGQGAAVDMYESSDMQIKNNVFSSTKLPVLNYTNVFSLKSDYNNLHTSGPIFANKDASPLNDFAAYKSSFLLDSNSLNLKSAFVNDTLDLHYSNKSLVAKGGDFVGVDKDIDGEIRNHPPCIGADEVFDEKDISLLRFLNPKTNQIFKVGDSTSVGIRIGNNSQTEINSFGLKLFKNDFLIFDVVLNLTIAAGDSVDFNFPKKIENLLAGSVKLCAELALGGDIKMDNNTKCINYSVEKNTGVFYAFKNEIQIFPNPVKDQLWLDLQGMVRMDVDIQIFNYLGQTISYTQSGSDNFIGLNIANSPAGLYFIRILGNGINLQQSFIKQ